MIPSEPPNDSLKVAERATWRTISANAIVLDRIRLTENCNFDNSPEIDAYLEKIVSKWQSEGENHLA